jgi:hypothetical protein
MQLLVQPKYCLRYQRGTLHCTYVIGLSAQFDCQTTRTSRRVTLFVSEQCIGDTQLKYLSTFAWQRFVSMLQ